MKIPPSNPHPQPIVAQPYPWGLDLNKLESPLLENASTQASAFSANWILRRKFLKDTLKFSIILIHLPLKEGVALYFDKLESPSAKKSFVQSLV